MSPKHPASMLTEPKYSSVSELLLLLQRDVKHRSIMQYSNNISIYKIYVNYFIPVSRYCVLKLITKLKVIQNNLTCALGSVSRDDIWWQTLWSLPLMLQAKCTYLQWTNWSYIRQRSSSPLYISAGWRTNSVYPVKWLTGKGCLIQGDWLPHTTFYFLPPLSATVTSLPHKEVTYAVWAECSYHSINSYPDYSVFIHVIPHSSQSSLLKLIEISFTTCYMTANYWSPTALISPSKKLHSLSPQSFRVLVVSVQITFLI